jgi:hypothetical protein
MLKIFNFYLFEEFYHLCLFFENQMKKFISGIGHLEIDRLQTKKKRKKTYNKIIFKFKNQFKFFEFLIGLFFHQWMKKREKEMTSTPTIPKKLN